MGFGWEVFDVRIAFCVGDVAGGFDEDCKLIVGDFGFIDPEAGDFDFADWGFFGEFLVAVRGIEAALGAHGCGAAGDFDHAVLAFVFGIRGGGRFFFAGDEEGGECDECEGFEKIHGWDVAWLGECHN